MDTRTVSDAELLDIGEVAKMTGVAPSALRYYERFGLIEPAGRNGLRRTFRPDAVDRIALIVNAQATGFSLGQIRDLIHSDPKTVRAQLVEKIDEIDRQIDEMEKARAHLGHALTCEHESILDCPTLRENLRELLRDRTAADR